MLYFTAFCIILQHFTTSYSILQRFTTFYIVFNATTPGGIRILADVYVSSYIFLHSYICLCVFAYFLCVFVYIFGFSSHKIDGPMGGGRLRHPPLINYQFHIKQIQDYIQKHTKICECK